MLLPTVKFLAPMPTLIAERLPLTTPGRDIKETTSNTKLAPPIHHKRKTVTTKIIHIFKVKEFP